MIAFSSVSEFEVRLPSGDEQTAWLHLFVHIRDQLDCITEYNLTSVIVQSDSSSISDLMNTFQNSTKSLTTNPLIQLLSSGNQNTVGQVLSSLSQQFNKINSESLQKAVSSRYFDEYLEWCCISYADILDGIAASTISISSLGSEPSATVRWSVKFPFVHFFLLSELGIRNEWISIERIWERSECVWQCSWLSDDLHIPSSDQHFQ